MWHFLPFLGLTLLLAGLWCIVATALDLDAFMNHPAAQPTVDSMGRTGARILYAVAGVVLAAIGAAILVWGFL